MPKDGALGQAYFDKNLPVVEERLKMAGVRLAAILNREISVPLVAPASATESRPAAPPETEGDAKFVGSRNSEVYHYPNCADVKKIKPENLVKYKTAPEGKRQHRGCPR